MIERQWKGTARPGQDDRYIDHLLLETFPGLQKIKGFIKASILQRETIRGTEFQIVTRWSSVEAIKGFAGEAYEEAVVPEVVREIMVEYDEVVAHYEVVREVSAS
jgi:heme-degrading monooxygenase HmoA